jgi:hypothetical protein
MILGAWLCAGLLASGRPSPWHRLARVTVIALLLIPVTRSVVVAGAVEPRFERAEPFAVAWKRLVTSPPFDAWAATGSAEYRVVRYIRECTTRQEPLLVLSPAPQVYYYADRPFAGRMGWYMEGYYNSDFNQRQNAAALEHDRPAIAIVDAGRESKDLATHPAALAYLARNYHQVGELPATDGAVLRVFGRNDRQATSAYPDAGWPCYR